MYSPNDGVTSFSAVGSSFVDLTVAQGVWVKNDDCAHEPVNQMSTLLCTHPANPQVPVHAPADIDNAAGRRPTSEELGHMITRRMTRGLHRVMSAGCSRRNRVAQRRWTY